MIEGPLARAAAAIRDASALLVTAGAGMGVDSGLPDFRGNEGFWRAYPPFAKLGLSFVDLANPRWFSRDPRLAWGFYGHRLALYRATRPHEGFSILRRWAANKPHGAFVFTSNVDGQFQRAGFDPERVLECHGALDWLQCTDGCGVGILRADDWEPDIDESSFRARGKLPECPRCGALLRPNVLMFGDGEWDGAREDEQSVRFERWLGAVGRDRLVIVECGAGTGVPTVRMTSERLSRALGATLVRINVREPEVPPGQLGLPLGALEALSAIDARL
ncbi:MAG: NAD-dependent protein deacetylase [Deltaproteobacteria bacterium]|nr:NAD-dependent protein deacetylase [Deltaproteobacteria bacterium]